MHITAVQCATCDVPLAVVRSSSGLQPGAWSLERTQPRLRSVNGRGVGMTVLRGDGHAASTWSTVGRRGPEENSSVATE